MARSKGYTFHTPEQIRAAYAKALGHAARVRIVRTLQTKEYLTFEELSALINLSHSALARHLEQLDRVSLLKPIELGEGKTGYALDRDAALTGHYLLAGVLNPRGNGGRVLTSWGEVG
ncbi:MAG: winged helix-turn-helix domain-containing protein [Lewinella sp.]